MCCFVIENSMTSAILLMQPSTQWSSPIQRQPTPSSALTLIALSPAESFFKASMKIDVTPPPILFLFPLTYSIQEHPSVYRTLLSQGKIQLTAFLNIVESEGFHVNSFLLTDGLGALTHVTVMHLFLSSSVLNLLIQLLL